jgi:TPR repeat protein
MAFTPSPGNPDKCPFCNAEMFNGSDEDEVKKMMKRAEANDAGAIYVLGSWYYNGRDGLQQDRAKGMELLTRAAELGSSKAHSFVGNNYRHGGDMKKAKFHYEAAAMLGCEAARCNLGSLESFHGTMERALKHLKIAASAGNYLAMNNLLTFFKQGRFSRAEMDSTLTVYNISCAEMRNEVRDAFINVCMQRFHQ